MGCSASPLNVCMNLEAKVMQRQRQGMWDCQDVEASCGLVIVGLRSSRAIIPLQQPDSSGIIRMLDETVQHQLGHSN